MAEQPDAGVRRLRLLVFAASGVYVILFATFFYVSLFVWGLGAMLIVTIIFMIPLLVGAVIRVVTSEPGVERIRDRQQVRRLQMVWLSLLAIVPLVFIAFYLVEMPLMLSVVLGVLFLACFLAGLPYFFPIGRKGA
jgi:hypothetical protein